MADGNEDLRADDLPGPAFEGYESMELACPAERSGHVAVSDGRHMFVWGGYKVSGWPGRCGRLSAVTRVPVGGPGGRAGAAASCAPRRLPAATLPVGSFSLSLSLACGNLLTSPPTVPKAPGLLSRQLAPHRTRCPARHPIPVAGAAPGGLLGRGALFWGRARWAVPDYETCFYSKALGGVCEVTLCAVLLALFRADPGHFTVRSRGQLPHRPRCPLSGDGGVRGPRGIPEGPRNRLTQPSRLSRASPLPLCRWPAHCRLNISGLFSFWFPLRKS